MSVLLSLNMPCTDLKNELYKNFIWKETLEYKFIGFQAIVLGCWSKLETVTFTCINVQITKLIPDFEEEKKSQCESVVYLFIKCHLFHNNTLI